MKTQKSYPKNASGAFGRRANDEQGRFVDRDLAAISPLKQQFEPTEAEPVSQHKKMAGAC